MGEATVTAKLENAYDRGSFEQGYSDANAVRATRIGVAVDIANAMLMLPETVVQRLGLEVQRSVIVCDADGGRALRPVAGPVTVELCGRSMCTSCIVGPPMSTASVGRIVLLELDLLVGAAPPGLYPRHPDHPILSLR